MRLRLPCVTFSPGPSRRVRVAICNGIRRGTGARHGGNWKPHVLKHGSASNGLCQLAGDRTARMPHLTWLWAVALTVIKAIDESSHVTSIVKCYTEHVARSTGD